MCGIPKLWCDHCCHLYGSFLLIQFTHYWWQVCLVQFSFHKQLVEVLTGCVTGGFSGNQRFGLILYGFLVAGCGFHCHLEKILPAVCFSCHYCWATNGSSRSTPKTITKNHSVHCGIVTPSDYKQVGSNIQDTALARPLGLAAGAEGQHRGSWDRALGEGATALPALLCLAVAPHPDGTTGPICSPRCRVAKSSLP